MKISVIIPAYNEEVRIIKTIERVINYFNNHPDLLAEIIVVDDGSNDQTKNAVLSVASPKLIILSHDKNQGKGRAIKTGMNRASGDWSLFMDADSSADISELDKFLPWVKNGFDIIIGSRALGDSKIAVHQNYIREFFGKLGNLLIRYLLNLHFFDTQCGFKLFNRRAAELFKEIKIDGWGFDVEILFLARKRGYKIKELPVAWSHNLSSSFNLLAYPRTFLDLIKIRFNNF